MWSAVLAIDDMIVVSEMGEQWSPKTAPERMAEMLDRSIPCCRTGASSWSSVTWMTSGIVNGVRLVFVPQDVPGEKLTAAATRKISPGNSSGAMTPESRPTR